MESMSAALDTIAEHVGNCEFYARMYKDLLRKFSSGPRKNDTIIQKLDTALPEFSASVLVFLAKAQVYFKTSFTSM